MKVNTGLGHRTEQLILEKKVFGEVFIDKVIDWREQLEIVGTECDLNGLTSPYTYIAKQLTFAFEIEAVGLYTDMMKHTQE